MKSKSPFAMKSPLNAYKYADTGEYAANASAKVIKPIVGAEIGMGIIKGAQNFKESYDSAKKGKADAEEKGRKNQLQEDLTRSQIELNESKAKNLNPTSALEDDTSFVSTGEFGDTSVEGMVESAMPKRNQILGAPENYKNPLTQMKGSPVKHNTGAAGAGELDARQNNPFARMLKSNNVQQKLDAAKSQPRNFAGVIAQAISDQGGSAAGSIGQQIGNQAQQGAADAGGSTGVDPFLPPPNQVAETGSYSGGGDRILEMDSNLVGNQSIGRDIDVASQLFGSGQRASMLAMKGTPLAHKTAAKHPEPHRKTKTFGGKLKPGDPYIVADNVDEGGSNPPDTLNLKKYKQPNYMSNPGDQYKKDQFPDEDIFSQNKDQLNKEGFNTDSTSSVRIFKG